MLETNPICHVTFGGKSFAHRTLEILTNPGHLKNVWADDYVEGDIPEAGVIVIGGFQYYTVYEHSVSKQHYFIGRIGSGSSLIVGKIHPVTQGFYYSTDNIHEIKGGYKDTYSVLMIQ